MAGYCEFCGHGPTCGVCGRGHQTDAERLAASLVGCTLAGHNGLAGPIFTVIDSQGEYIRVDRHHTGGILDSRYVWHADSTRHMHRIA